MGDGINDVSALTQARLGISVSDAVDVDQKRQADIVLAWKKRPDVLYRMASGLGA